MLALCRLLERQGIFKGDLNTLQQLALQAVIVGEQKELITLEKSRFKQMLVAAHPQFADSILTEEEEADSNPDVAPGFDYDTFDENADHSLSPEDYAAMQEMLGDIEANGYQITEYE